MPASGALPDPGTEPVSPTSPALQVGALPGAPVEGREQNVEWPKAEERFPQAWSQNARGEAGSALPGGGEEAWC